MQNAVLFEYACNIQIVYTGQIKTVYFWLTFSLYTYRYSYAIVLIEVWGIRLTLCILFVHCCYDKINNNVHSAYYKQNSWSDCIHDLSLHCCYDKINNNTVHIINKAQTASMTWIYIIVASIIVCIDLYVNVIINNYSY